MKIKPSAIFERGIDLIDITRTCACGELYTVTITGARVDRARQRCDKCRKKALSLAQKKWLAKNPGYMKQWQKDKRRFG
jgi:hypothetical protein